MKRLSCAIPLFLILCLALSSGCQTMTSLGGQVRATIEPPAVKADTYVGIADAKAQRLSEIVTKLSTGQPVSIEERQELTELMTSIATATGIAKSSMENVLYLIRLLPEKK